MSKRSNFSHNYPLLINYLKDNGIEYSEFAEGQHIKVLGSTSLVEVWPAQMTCHVIAGEYGASNAYFRLNRNFNAEELEKIL